MGGIGTDASCAPAHGGRDHRWLQSARFKAKGSGAAAAARKIYYRSILKSKRQRGDWNSSTSSIDDDLEQIIFEFILDKF